jgi:hypothetical protein
MHPGDVCIHYVLIPNNIAGHKRLEYGCAGPEQDFSQETEGRTLKPSDKQEPTG